MKGKVLAVGIIIFIVAAVIPWIYLQQQYGLTNIQHYDLTMWIFMMLYFLICTIVLFGFILLIVSWEEAPKSREKKKPEKKLRVKKEKKTGSKKGQPQEKPKVEPMFSDKEVAAAIGKVHPTEEEAPAELQENGTEQLRQIEYPAEWDEEEFE